MDPEKQEVLKQLRSIKSQLGSIRQMVETEQYCGDILHQTTAMRKAIEQVEALLLKQYLRQGVREVISENCEDATIEGWVQLYQLVGQR